MRAIVRFAGLARPAERLRHVHDVVAAELLFVSTNGPSCTWRLPC